MLQLKVLAANGGSSQRQHLSLFLLYYSALGQWQCHNSLSEGRGEEMSLGSSGVSKGTITVGETDGNSKSKGWTISLHFNSGFKPLVIQPIE